MYIFPTSNLIRSVYAPLSGQKAVFLRSMMYVSPPQAVYKCALPKKRLPPWVGKLREAVMRGIARRSRISFRQEYRVRKDISCRQAYRLREAQQKRYSVDAERYACLRKHDMFAFANTICGVMPAQIENHPIENSSSDTYLDSLFHE